MEELHKTMEGKGIERSGMGVCKGNNSHSIQPHYGEGEED
jgi:hypothetical protein